jgi:hypothetical protein
VSKSGATNLIGDMLITEINKYYRFIEPGQMLWGHDKEIMEIINMENN